MARQVIIAFCGEGPTDHDVLPHLLQRLVEAVLAEGGAETDVLRPFDYPVAVLNVSGVQEQYRVLAEQVAQADLICVHHDADNLSLEQRRAQNFRPGVAAVAWPASGSHPIFVGVIPVREMEAWLLADENALTDVIGDIPPSLDFPRRTRDVERALDPKGMLEAIIRHQTRKLPSGSVLRETLAQQINLRALSALPAVQQLRKDLTMALTERGFLSP